MLKRKRLPELPRYAVNHYERGDYLAPSGWVSGGCYSSKAHAEDAVRCDERPSVARSIRSGRVVSLNPPAKAILKQ